MGIIQILHEISAMVIKIINFLNSNSILFFLKTIACDPTCATCTTSGSSACTSCHSGKYLDLNICVEGSQITTMGNIVSNTMQVQSATSGLIPILSGGFSTTAIILVGFLSEIEIYKFINVSFPENFVLFCENLDVSLFPNVFAIIDDVNEGNNPNSTHGKFAFWGVSKVMLDNSYPSILKNLGVLAALAITSLLAYILRGSPNFSYFFSKIRDLLMWNLTLSFYLGDYTELQLYSMIQLSENSVSSTYSRLSYAFSIIIIVTYSVLMIYIAILLNSKKRAPYAPELNNRKNVSRRGNIRPNEGSSNSTTSESLRDLPSSTATLNRCSILIEDFDQSSTIGKNFMLVILGQNLAMILTLFFLQSYKMTQAILYTLLTSAYLALILFKRPYKSLVQTGILTLNNSCKILMGIIALLLAVNESSSFMSQGSVSILGSVLIYTIVTTIILNLIIGLAITLREIFQKLRKQISSCKELKYRRSKKIENKKITIFSKSDRSRDLKAMNYWQRNMQGLERESRIFPPQSEHRSLGVIDLDRDLNQSVEKASTSNSSFENKHVSQKLRRKENIRGPSTNIK